jgi:hypothetical protein
MMIGRWHGVFMSISRRALCGNLQVVADQAIQSLMSVQVSLLAVDDVMVASRTARGAEVGSQAGARLE